MSHYDRIGATYAATRRPDPRIERQIADALGDARSVVNVGAGIGAYEPRDRDVTAVEPSAVMLAQRPPDAAPAIQGSAEALPFDDDSFDAALAVPPTAPTASPMRVVEAAARVPRRDGARQHLELRAAAARRRHGATSICSRTTRPTSAIACWWPADERLALDAVPHRRG